MLQRTILQRTILQRTILERTILKQKILQRTNATTNECYNERSYNERMLQRTVFINKIRMLQRKRRNTIGRSNTRVRMTFRAFPLWLERQSSSFFLDFKLLAVFWMSYAIFWVIPRRPNFICRRYGTLCLFHLQRQVGMKMEYTECSETLAYKIQTPGNYPEESIHHLCYRL